MSPAGSGLRKSIVERLAAGGEITSAGAAGEFDTTVKHARRVLTELGEEGVAVSARKGRGPRLVYRLVPGAAVSP